MGLPVFVSPDAQDKRSLFLTNFDSLSGLRIGGWQGCLHPLLMLLVLAVVELAKFGRVGLGKGAAA